MYKSDSSRILRNLDKIRHHANGGRFDYCYKTAYHKNVSGLNLPHLDHYIIRPTEKPRYRYKRNGVVRFERIG